MLLNLNSNAIKFSKPNSTIQNRVKNISTMLVFEVLDYGIGIAEENKAHLFSPYFRIMDKQSLELNPNGNGLGLSICKNICNSLGGYIDCFSEPDIGTNFVFTMVINNG